MLLGLAAGKVGDLVFYRDGGEQRTRTRVIPKNPRSPKQMTQRVKISNVSGIYRAAASVLRDSFTNRPSNQSGYNAFASGAIVNAPYFTSQMAKAGVCIPQPAMMSRGVLSTLPYDVVADDDLGGIGLPVDLDSLRPSTIGDLSRGIIQQYPSVSDGDEINFCTLKFSPEVGVDSEVDYYAVSFVSDSLTIDTSSASLIGDSTVDTTTTLVRGKKSSSLSSDDIYMSFIIHSRVGADGSLMVSTQWAYLSEAAQSLYDGYRTASALGNALRSYRDGRDKLLR